MDTCMLFLPIRMSVNSHSLWVMLFDIHLYQLLQYSGVHIYTLVTNAMTVCVEVLEPLISHWIVMGLLRLRHVVTAIWQGSREILGKPLPTISDFISWLIVRRVRVQAPNGTSKKKAHKDYQDMAGFTTLHRRSGLWGAAPITGYHDCINTSWFSWGCGQIWKDVVLFEIEL